MFTSFTLTCCSLSCLQFLFLQLSGWWPLHWPDYFPCQFFSGVIYDVFLREAWCWVANSKETGEKWLPVILNVLGRGRSWDWLCSLIALNCGPSSQGILVNHSFFLILPMNKGYDLEFEKQSSTPCYWYAHDLQLTSLLILWPTMTVAIIENTVPNLAFSFVTWHDVIKSQPFCFILILHG